MVSTSAPPIGPLQVGRKRRGGRGSDWGSGRTGDLFTTHDQGAAAGF